VFFEREDKASLEGTAGSDAGSERDEFRGEMLGLDRTGASVADDRKLGGCGWIKEEGAGKEK
jgi:hypothetical protein